MREFYVVEECTCPNCGGSGVGGRVMGMQFVEPEYYRCHKCKGTGRIREDVPLREALAVLAIYGTEESGDE
jgi:hypothetical protein